MTGNIFDEASKQGKKKGQNAPILSQKNKETPQRSQVNDSEVTRMLARMNEMSEDIKEKLTELQRLGKARNIDIDRYMNYLYNTSPKEMEKIQGMHAQLLKEIAMVLPPESCVRKVGKSVGKLTQERKGKTLGARKKWIPMK